MQRALPGRLFLLQVFELIIFHNLKLNGHRPLEFAPVLTMLLMEQISLVNQMWLPKNPSEIDDFQFDELQHQARFQRHNSTHHYQGPQRKNAL